MPDLLGEPGLPVLACLLNDPGLPWSDGLFLNSGLLGMLDLLGEPGLPVLACLLNDPGLPCSDGLLLLIGAPTSSGGDILLLMFFVLGLLRFW